MGPRLHRPTGEGSKQPAPAAPRPYAEAVASPGVYTGPLRNGSVLRRVTGTRTAPC